MSLARRRLDTILRFISQNGVLRQKQEPQTITVTRGLSDILPKSLLAHGQEITITALWRKMSPVLLLRQCGMPLCVKCFLNFQIQRLLTQKKKMKTSLNLCLPDYGEVASRIL